MNLPMENPYHWSYMLNIHIWQSLSNSVWVLLYNFKIKSVNCWLIIFIKNDKIPARIAGRRVGGSGYFIRGQSATAGHVSDETPRVTGLAGWGESLP